MVAGIGRLLGKDLPHAQVVLSATTSQFRAMLPAGSRVPKWAAAVAYPRRRLIIMGPLSAVASNEQVLRLLTHEYSHLALAHATAFHPVPTWFSEGLADLQAGRGLDQGPFSFGRALPLSRLGHGFPGRADRAGDAYGQSRDFVAFLISSRSEKDFRRLIELVRQGVAFDTAIERVYGKPLDTLRRSWRSNWRYRKVIVPLFTSGALMWVLAIFLLVLGHRRRRRQLRNFETMPDERDEEIETMETEAEDQGPAVHMEIPPGSFLLAAGGLALLLAALLETVWPRVRWTTLLFVAGIVVSLGLIGLWKMSRNNQEPEEETAQEHFDGTDQEGLLDEKAASPTHRPPSHPSQRSEEPQP